jgi:hypothetical protein
MTKSEAQDFEAKLEMHIDKTSLQQVVLLISMICDEKAIHIESNWQDRALAKSWRHDAKLIEAVARKLDN